ncbi:spore germination protein [Paenibacillus pedocola]|uniref:spore germination protein n=1 Tax=Paenibacillus pedocola TaxID=3242193 RepID=UPI002877FC7E|nr:spore germination protein [Paenibacillus typhae]
MNKGPKDTKATPADASKTKQPITAQFSANLKWLKDNLGASSDIVVRSISDRASGMEGAIIYVDHLVDQQTVNQMIVHPILAEIGSDSNLSPLDWLELLKNKALSVGRIEEVQSLDVALAQLLDGNTVILLQGCASALSASSSGGEKRGVEEPSTQTVVRGPKESFTESIDTNLSLIRRRIKSPLLRIEFLQIGKQTMTRVAVLHMKGIAKESILEEALTRLERIDTDSILDSGYIEEYIQDATFTPFPTMLSTERPDAVVGSLLEGQFAVVVDGSPFALIAPVTFGQFFQSSEDYYQRYDVATFLRIIRNIAFFVSLLFPSLFIAITTFHQEMLPPPLLISLTAQREGVPFPAIIEALLMEITFEVLREAGVRMPRAIGPAISIVGALVLGQAAVQAGIVSAALVIVVSFTALANFVIPSINMSNAIRLLRFVMMLLAAMFGLFGILCGLMTLLIHLASLRSFGIAYLTPFSPFIWSNWKDILRAPRWTMRTRPISMSSGSNRTRQGRGQGPQTPHRPGRGNDPNPGSNE